MVSTENGSRKQSVNYPNYGDNLNMMNQGLREMNLNVNDSDDWLVVNNGTDTRARTNPWVGSNPPYAAWGQPGLLQKPRTHNQVPWNNYHIPSAGFVGRPPNVVDSRHNGMFMGNLRGQPVVGNGLGVDGRGTYDGMRSKDGGSSIPVINVDSDSSGDEAEGDYSGGGAKNNVNHSNARTKGVQGVTPRLWAHLGVFPQAYNSWVNAPSNAMHPGFGNYGWNFGGRGVTPISPMYPTPPSSCGREFERNGKDKSKADCCDDGKIPDEFDDLEYDMKQSNWSFQNRQVGEDPRLGMHGNVPHQGFMPPLYPNHSWQWASGCSGVWDSHAGVARHVGKKEVHRSTHNINATNRSFSHGVSKKCVVRQKNTQNSYAEEGSTSKKSAMNSEPKPKGVVLLGEGSSGVVDKVDEVENEVEDNCGVRQTSQSKEDVKGKKQRGKDQIKEESGEAIDACAGKLFQKERKKMPEQSTVDHEEDWKRRTMELVAAIAKARISYCIKAIEQMKKRHQKEEEMLYEEYNDAVKDFSEKSRRYAEFGYKTYDHL